MSQIDPERNNKDFIHRVNRFDILEFSKIVKTHHIDHKWSALLQQCYQLVSVSSVSQGPELLLQRLPDVPDVVRGPGTLPSPHLTLPLPHRLDGTGRHGSQSFGHFITN